METKTLFVNVGNYQFKITDNTYFHEGLIYNRNFKIGGNIPDCVNIFTICKNGQFVSANIPYLLTDPNCSFGVPLERGKGSIIMIKTLFKYIKETIPEVTEFNFEDKSNIDCATEDEISKSSKYRKAGTSICPVPLYYFSIAFNGVTWYEKHFNAKQQNPEKHAAYRERVEYLLNSEEFKESVLFIDFISIAQISIEIKEELELYYNSSKTFGGFLKSIPNSDKCRLVRDWIDKFMKYYLKDVFSNEDWVIDLAVVPLTGGNRKTQKKYYCPGKINRNGNNNHKDVGADTSNVFY